MFNHGENVNTIDITNTITTNLHKYDQEYFYSAEKLVFAPNSDIIIDIKKNLSSFKNHKIIIYQKKDISDMNSVDKYYNMRHQTYDYDSIVDKNILVKKIKFNLEIIDIKEPKMIKVKNIYQPKRINNV